MPGRTRPRAWSVRNTALVFMGIGQAVGEWPTFTGQRDKIALGWQDGADLLGMVCEFLAGSPRALLTCALSSCTLHTRAPQTMPQGPCRGRLCGIVGQHTWKTWPTSSWPMMPRHGWLLTSLLWSGFCAAVRSAGESQARQQHSAPPRVKSRRAEIDPPRF